MSVDLHIFGENGQNDDKQTMVFCTKQSGGMVIICKYPFNFHIWVVSVALSRVSGGGLLAISMSNSIK